MKTCLIDKSLCYMPVKNDCRSEDLIEYILSLYQSGIDYVEIDAAVIARIGVDKIPKSPRYILSISNPKDVLLLKQHDFDYALIGIKSLGLLKKINIPVILEIGINLELSTELAVLLSAYIDTGNISMIRFTGNAQAYDNLDKQINFFKKYFSIPINICPLNGNLNALSLAINAYAKRTDAITLCFGSSGEYASLQEFIITLFSMFGIFVLKDFNGLCKAAVLYNYVSEHTADVLRPFIKQLEFSADNLVNIDTNSDADKIHQMQVSKVMTKIYEDINQKYETSNMHKLIYSMGYKPEIADSLTNILDDSNPRLNKTNINSKLFLN